MGVLMGKMLQLFWGGQQHKIVVIGLDNAGKTTLLYRLLLGQNVSTTTPTIGSNVEEITYKNLTFTMWDLGGQDSIRSSWSAYYQDASCIILVVDSSDKARLSLAKDELHKMASHEETQKASILIFANKQDLPESSSAATVSEALGLPSLRDRPWHLQGCSAKTGRGINDGLDWVVTQLVKPSS
ncbi:MAG: ADP ribosylation factor [Piptocephalis tieghemiana]|nr:MAG: ADP ribosylation factor [Piptocephalis tieghemiana]